MCCFFSLFVFNHVFNSFRACLCLSMNNTAAAVFKGVFFSDFRKHYQKHKKHSMYIFIYIFNPNDLSHGLHVNRLEHVFLKKVWVQVFVLSFSAWTCKVKTVKVIY